MGHLSFNFANSICYLGAARGIRTPDPIITNDVLYRLSYCGYARGDSPGAWALQARAVIGGRASASPQQGNFTRTACATSLPAWAAGAAPHRRRDFHYARAPERRAHASAE